MTTTIVTTCTCSMTTDTNECKNNEHNCSDRMNCENTMGSFVCTCKEGYNSSMGNEEECPGNKKCMIARSRIYT